MSKKRKDNGSRPDRRTPLLRDVSIAELLGRIIITWNNLEASCRSLLSFLCDHPPGIKSLTNELNGQSLYLALRSLGPHSVAPETQEIVEALAQGLQRLNDHRNYYVHGAMSVGGATGRETLTLTTSYAKGEIKIYEDIISKREMWEISEDAAILGLRAFDLCSYLMLKKQGLSPKLPDKPFLPPELKKTRR